DAIYPAIIRTTAESMLIFWTDLHNIYAQQLDMEGNLSWPAGDINIGWGGDSRNMVNYYAASDGKGGAVIVWNFQEGDKKYIQAQRIDSKGNKLWGDKGIVLSTLPPYWAGFGVPSRIAPDGTGGFIVTWASGKNIKDKTSSYIQRIDPDGNLLWGEHGIKLNP
ncbi:MAG: hypothetical protein PHN78_09270, partial [Dehalococcoidales bacterium]|nr:hypothetical protein [Dehalococcoidales bacterium]